MESDKSYYEMTVSMTASASSSPATPKATADRLRKEITGARRLSTYFVASVVSIGALGFLLASLSSYTGTNFLILSDATSFVFVPQGVAMGFYGVAGSLLAAYLWLTAVWNIGGGYNEFDRRTGKGTMFRQGYPGKNRQVELTFKLSDVQAVRVQIKEGLNPKRSLYLRVKGLRDLPLTPVGQPIPLSNLENQGAELARFLGVPLEGL